MGSRSVNITALFWQSNGARQRPRTSARSGHFRREAPNGSSLIRHKCHCSGGVGHALRADGRFGTDRAGGHENSRPHKPGLDIPADARWPPRPSGILDQQHRNTPRTAQRTGCARILYRRGTGGLDEKRPGPLGAQQRGGSPDRARNQPRCALRLYPIRVGPRPSQALLEPADLNDRGEAGNVASDAARSAQEKRRDRREEPGT